MNSPRIAAAFGVSLVLAVASMAHAALLAYEPFTNAPGSAIIGSGNGFGFSGAWQANSSSGVATNTSYGLTYTDSATNSLLTAGGAGLFQGNTTINSAMQPIRLFNFTRGTNGTDGVTTWFSFLVVRQGPTGTLSGNPYGRGANVPLDNSSTQKLATGNSSGVSTNTVGLIPQGSSGNLVSSAITFGGATNFVVLRIDHRPGANDVAYLFMDPNLGAEPPASAASAVSSNSFDFSFNRLRVFAGGQTNAQQRYAELVVDEVRVGETYADVTPHTSVTTPPVPWGPLVITNYQLTPGQIVLSGIGGSNNGSYFVMSSPAIGTSTTNWSPVATNSFDANGRFASTNPTTPGAQQEFFRLLVGAIPGPPAIIPSITAQPTNLTIPAGNTAAFFVQAGGTAPLLYQWYFNTNTLLSGKTNASISITNAQGTDAGTYSVIVHNSAGSTPSSFALLTVNVPANIVTSPASQTVTVSNNVTFQVVAGGNAPLSYQWYFNTNASLAGATNASLTLTNVQFTNAGGYSAIVTNSFASATSLVATLTVVTNPTAATFYVATNGSDSDPGTITQPFLTITKGLTAVSNAGLVYVRGGTYPMSSKLILGKFASPANPIKLWAYPGEVPVIDSSGNSSDGVSVTGRCYYIKGITVTLAGHNGINISGHSNTVENCVTHDNGNTGLHITGGQNSTTFPSYNLILNCDSYRNYDPPVGGNADGFSAKWDLGPGNVFRGCRAWENSDDGWDLWMGNSPVLIDQCWAFRQGFNWWNSSQYNGNGNGFKLGGNNVPCPHRLAHSVTFHNAANGVDQNNNTAGQTVDQVTSWANGKGNFDLQHGANTTPHVVRNNLSLVGTNSDSFTVGTLATNNSWQVLAPDATTNDVISIDETVAVAPRQADGSLPIWPFLRPVPAGRLIDKGVDIGEPFNGAAPDLGAFEDGP